MVPVIVLTGFLGSGKTTLLNRLMTRRPAGGGRMAIIVNELGQIGIDGELLPSGMTRQVELPGGCICCALNEDLDKTITELLDGTAALELIVIETTGIAEPMPIAWTMAREPLADRVRLAAVVTVVDALEHERNRTLSPSVDAQVEYADLLALSKLDLVSEESAAAVAAALTAQNPGAPVLAGTPDEVADQLWRALADPVLDGGGRRQRTGFSEPGTGAPEHRHAPAHGAFDTVSLAITGTLDFEEFGARLEELPANYVRIKGIARVVDESTGSSEPRVVAFHRVGTRVSCEPVPAGGDPRMVALGPGIERARLAACLDASVIPCPTRTGIRGP
jgi:G3E family GTPase